MQEPDDNPWSKVLLQYLRCLNLSGSQGVLVLKWEFMNVYTHIISHSFSFNCQLCLTIASLVLIAHCNFPMILVSASSLYSSILASTPARKNTWMKCYYLLLGKILNFPSPSDKLLLIIPSLIRSWSCPPQVSYHSQVSAASWLNRVLDPASLISEFKL